MLNAIMKATSATGSDSSALAMVVSIQFATYPWHGAAGVMIGVDPARIAYSVMTGVGFLGAGTIIHTRGTILGLTTAAGL